VGVFVDVQNLYYSAKNLYNTKVNFQNILKTAVGNRKLVRAIAYVIIADIKEEAYFHGALEKIGYEVKSKKLQVFYGGSKKGDWDIGIAMDVMRLAAKLDVVVLVSGDGDFVDLLQHADALGCRREVIAFGKTASSKIKEEADLFVDMDKEKRKYLIGKRLPPRRPNPKMAGNARVGGNSKGNVNGNKVIGEKQPTAPPMLDVGKTQSAKPIAKPVEKLAEKTEHARPKKTVAKKVVKKPTKAKVKPKAAKK